MVSSGQLIIQYNTKCCETVYLVDAKARRRKCYRLSSSATTGEYYFLGFLDFPTLYTLYIPCNFECGNAYIGQPNKWPVLRRGWTINNTALQISCRVSVKELQEDQYRILRKYFFSHRVVSHWNGLPQHVVEAPSVNCFKARLDRHWKDMDVHKP